MYLKNNWVYIKSFRFHLDSIVYIYGSDMAVLGDCIFYSYLNL